MPLSIAQRPTRYRSNNRNPKYSWTIDQNRGCTPGTCLTFLFAELEGRSEFIESGEQSAPLLKSIIHSVLRLWPAGRESSPGYQATLRRSRFCALRKVSSLIRSSDAIHSTLSDAIYLIYYRGNKAFERGTLFSWSGQVSGAFSSFALVIIRLKRCSSKADDGTLLATVELRSACARPTTPAKRLPCNGLPSFYPQTLNFKNHRNSKLLVVNRFFGFFFFCRQIIIQLSSPSFGSILSAIIFAPAAKGRAHDR